ncbi:MAG: hypothetical protein K2X82_33435 [Gemmataceae bacterium]|nr:hypothetical protein [Gemmataceae bacterium]
MMTPAAQLIYTNVEADRSPARQRGFQVWLASPDLTPEQRRAVAKRVDDFRLPPGVRPDDLSAVRHVFARLDDDLGGLFVVARTGPLADRDKFGRGGKFHAHAVLLSNAAFKQLGYDPFRVIDGGFPFHSCPDDAGDVWKTGELGPAEVRPGEPSADVLDLPAERVRELLAHVGRDDDKPVVVPDKPAKVLAVLRGLFRAAPPSLRVRLSFDTLSGGTALAQVRYAVAGAYSAEVLRLWSFRKYHRLNPATGACTPPLDKAPGLPGELLSAPGWNDLSDADRDAVSDAARALTDGRLADLRPGELSPAAVDVLASCPGFAGARTAAATAVVGQAVPAALAALPEVQIALGNYFTGSPAETLARLTEPVPREAVSEGLLASPVWSAEPPAAAIAALQEWATKPTPRKLVRVLQRWRGLPADLSAVEADLDDEAFRGWVARTLRGRGLSDFRARVAVGRPAAPKDVRDARLWLALHPDPADPGWADLKLSVTLYSDPKGLARAVAGPPRLAGATDWLARAVAARIKDRAAFRWADDGLGNTLLGAFVTPDGAADEALLTALVGLDYRAPVREVLAHLGLARPSGPTADAVPQVPAAGKHHHVEVLAARPDRRPAAVALYREYLAAADDDTYRAMANLLLQQVGGSAAARAIDDTVYFVGLRLVWVQQANPAGQLGLFGAVAGAAVPEYRVGTPLGAIKPLGVQSARRLAWLTARLADPAGTERLRV